MLGITLNTLGTALEASDLLEEAVEAFRDAVHVLNDPSVGATRSRDASLAATLARLTSCLSLLGREGEADAAGEESEFLYSWSEAANDTFLNADPFIVSTVLQPRGPDFYLT